MYLCSHIETTIIFFLSYEPISWNRKGNFKQGSSELWIFCSTKYFQLKIHILYVLIYVDEWYQTGSTIHLLDQEKNFSLLFYNWNSKLWYLKNTSYNYLMEPFLGLKNNEATLNFLPSVCTNWVSLTNLISSFRNVQSNFSAKE